MPRRANPDRAGPIFAAVHRLIVRGGCEAATVRAVALEAGMSPGGVRHNFSQHSRLLACAFWRVGDELGRRARMRYLALSTERHEVWPMAEVVDLLMDFLPGDSDGLEMLRVLHSFQARARHDAEVGESVGAWEETVRSYCVVALRFLGLDRTQAEREGPGLHALVTGLTAAAVPVAGGGLDGFTEEDVRRTLATHLRGVLGRGGESG